MSVQGEISRLSSAKAELKAAIEGGGVTVSAGARIEDYPALVSGITAQIGETLDEINGEVI